MEIFIDVGLAATGEIKLECLHTDARVFFQNVINCAGETSVPRHVHYFGVEYEVGIASPGA
jgi:hypothetical protein